MTEIIKGKFYEIPQEKWLSDGVYIFSEEEDITFLCKENSITNMKQDSDVDKFMQDNPNWVVGCAYETFTTILLSKRPRNYDGLTFGSGFNYGSTNILCGLPSSINYILILAQND